MPAALFATRRCTSCARTKKRSQFARKGTRGYHTRCRDCQRPVRHQNSSYACTLDDIAAEIGVTRERVRQIEVQALAKLRNRLAFLLQRDLRQMEDRDLVSLLFR